MSLRAGKDKGLLGGNRRPLLGWLLVPLCLCLAAISVSHACAENDPNGSGLFALSLEEVLEIKVTPDERITTPHDGYFSLTTHEAVRLYQHSISIAATKSALTGFTSVAGVVVLVDGEYFGSFESIRSALRFGLRNRDTKAHLDIYLGTAARWFESGAAGVVLDLRSASRDTSDRSRTLQVSTEVQP